MDRSTCQWHTCLTMNPTREACTALVVQRVYVENENAVFAVSCCAVHAEVVKRELESRGLHVVVRHT